MTRTCRQSWILIVAASLVAACLGCENGETPNGPDLPNGKSGNNGPVQGTPNKGSPTQKKLPAVDPLQPAKMPEVFLSEEQRKWCRVVDGEIMPDADLPDLDGKPQPVSKLRGQKLTVLCLWKCGETDAGRLKALEILGDLQDLSESYLEKGVRVIGINEGDPPEVVRICIADAKGTFPNLLDPDRAFFDKIATEKLPRVYLLDPEGKILWFDLEFSPTTRRNLKKGIQVELGEI